MITTHITGQMNGHPLEITIDVNADNEGKAAVAIVKALLNAYVDEFPSFAKKMEQALPTLHKATKSFAKAFNKLKS